MIKEMIKAHPTEIGCQGKQGTRLTLCAGSLRSAHGRTRPADSTPDAPPRDAEVLAFEADGRTMPSAKSDEVDCQGGPVYVHPPAATTSNSALVISGGRLGGSW
jgi:hypothetical protein